MQGNAAKHHRRIADWIRLFPRREAGSKAERQFQDALSVELAAYPGQTFWQEFHCNRNLYQVIQAHLCLALFGSVISLTTAWTWGALSLHLAPCLLYPLDSLKCFRPLRKFLPQVRSHNLVHRVHDRPDPPQSRVVLLAHVDAAPASILFHPWLLGLAKPTWLPLGLQLLLGRQMLLLQALYLALIVIDVVYLITGYFMVINAWIGVFLLCVVLGLLTDAAWFRQIVPGANDNLSGCQGLCALLRQEIWRRYPTTEFVFGWLGAEEAGNNGALHLQRTLGNEWRSASTLVLSLDAIAGGKLCYLLEGEFAPYPIDQELLGCLRQTAKMRAEWAELTAYYPPAGATDAAVFQRAGFPAVNLSRIDPQIMAPQQYHRLTDDAAHLDAGSLESSIAFAEALIEVWLTKGGAGSLAVSSPSASQG